MVRGQAHRLVNLGVGGAAHFRVMSPTACISVSYWVGGGHFRGMSPIA